MKEGIKFYFLDNERWGLGSQNADVDFHYFT